MAARRIPIVVAKKTANKCRRRKNGLQVNKYPRSLWPVSYGTPHFICQGILCFKKMNTVPDGCK